MYGDPEKQEPKFKVIRGKMKSHVKLYQCYFCGEDIGILLDRWLRDARLMKAGCIDLTPCEKCKEWMEKGILLMSISNNTTPEEIKGPLPNPLRTGGWTVVKDEELKPILSQSDYDFAKKYRFMFITDEAWQMIGLPEVSTL